MLASQKRAVRQWVIDGLAAAGKPVDAERVVQGQQDAGFPRPYAFLIWTGGSMLGPAPERASVGDHGSAQSVARRWGPSTVSITFVGPVNSESFDDDASEFAAQLEPQLWAPDLSEGYEAAGLSVQSSSVTTGIESITGQSQHETRATLDITWNTATVTTSTPGTVAEVEITATTEPPTIEDTITVGP